MTNVVKNSKKKIVLVVELLDLNFVIIYCGIINFLARLSLFMIAIVMFFHVVDGNMR